MSEFTIFTKEKLREEFGSKNIGTINAELWLNSSIGESYLASNPEEF